MYEKPPNSRLIHDSRDTCKMLLINCGVGSEKPEPPDIRSRLMTQLHDLTVVQACSATEPMGLHPLRMPNSHNGGLAL